MAALRRSFRVAVAPEQLVEYAKIKFPDAKDTSAKVRIDRVRRQGFHLLRAAGRHAERGEWVAAVRVRLAREGEGTLVEVSDAGTLLRGSVITYMVATAAFAALWLSVWLLRPDDPDALWFGLGMLAMFAGGCWPIVANYRRRDAHFAELTDALQQALQPLTDAELAPIALRVAAEYHEESDAKIFERALASVRRAPATLALGVVLVTMFALAAAWGETTASETLQRMGGMRGEDLARGEWWRLLSSGFVHAGTRHLGGNLQTLVVCYVAEVVLGSSRFVVLFTLSVLGGSIAAALATSPSVVVVGASGGIFGLAAAILLLTVREPRLMPVEHAARLRGGFMLLLAINLALSLLPGISLAGHVGGALVGAALVATRAITFGHTRIWRDEWPRPEVARWFRIAAAICALALAGSVALALAHGRPWLMS